MAGGSPERSGPNDLGCDVMISAHTFFGGGTFVDASAGTGTRYLQIGLGRVQSWGGGSGLSLRLPDARELNLGGPVFLIFNVGSNALTIRDFDGGSVRAVSATTGAGQIFLFGNSTAAGDWIGIPHTYSVA